MSAVMSACRKYRYRLSREVDVFGTRTIAYFGINPSTADEFIDDQTVRKWIGFTQRLQGKSFLVGNAFAYRATDVTRLAEIVDPVGPENDENLRAIIAAADVLIPCWGSRQKLPRKLHGRLDTLLESLLNSGKPVFSFGMTRSNDPKHPLLLPYDTELQDMQSHVRT